VKKLSAQSYPAIFCVLVSVVQDSTVGHISHCPDGYFGQSVLHEAAWGVQQIAEATPHLLIHLLKGGIEHLSGQQLFAAKNPRADVF
jgi:hypothetical protein